MTATARAGAAALLCAVVIAPARAPAHAAGTGAIVGRVVNATTGRPQPGVEVTLTGGRNGELRRTLVTDGRGRYRFDGLDTGSDRVYALDARFDGGLFAGRAVTLTDDTRRRPVITSTLRVWETTTDPTAIVVSRNTLFVVPDREGGAAVIQSLSVANTSGRAYIGRGASADRGEDTRSRPAAPTLAVALPPRADERTVRILDATLDVPALVELDGLGGFGTTAAIPPGDSSLAFSYRVEGAAGRFDLTQRALYPVLRMSIYTRDPFSLESDRLRDAGSERVGGDVYRVWSAAGELDAGDVVQAEVVAEAGLGALNVALVALAFVAVVAGGVALARRRRAPTPAVEERARDDLLTAIAELDLRYRSGELNETEWSRRRAELKAELVEAPAPGP